MQFLHPAFLIGLGAVAFPVLIHFVFRMKAPVVLFPSIRFLRQVDRKVAKRQKLEELLLLLLRCLGLVLLALALAGPLIKQFGSAPGSAGTAAVLVLDDSYSMGALDSGGAVFDGAKGMAGAVLNTLKPGDSACVLAGARKAELSRDIEALRNGVKNLEVSWGAETLAGRTKAAMDLLQHSEAAQHELYVISDFQKRAVEGLRKISFEAPNFTAILIPVKPAKPQNLTLTSFEQISPFATLATPLRVRASVENAGDEGLTRNLKFKVGDQTAVTQMLTVAAHSSTVTVADLQLDKPGWMPVSAELSDDNLAADNTRWLACDARAYLGVLICRPNPQGETGSQSRSFYLEKALNPGASGHGAAGTGLQILTCTPADFANQNLDTVSAIFMVECAPKDDDGRVLLNRFVSRGGGLGIIAGVDISGETFNSAYFRENDPAGPLSPAKWNGAWGASENDPNHDTVFQTIKDVAAQHPIFARLRRGEIPVDISTAEFYRFAKLEVFERYGAQTLARFGNSMPAIVEHPYGMGRVVLIASALHSDSTRLPLRVGFLPLVQCLALHLLTPGRADNLKVGEHIALELVKESAPPTAQLVLSPKEKLDAKAEASGAMVAYDFGAATRPGVFPLEWTDGTRKMSRLVAVNVEADEGKLEYADPAGVGIPKANVVTSEAQLLALLKSVRFGHNLSILTLVLALLILIGEALLANRLALSRSAE